MLRWLWCLAVACVLLLAPRARAQADEVPISDEARRQFDVGVKLLQDPDGARYAEAFRHFKQAYAISPSPKILLNLGICAMKIERDGEALDAFRTYLAKIPDIDEALRAQIQNDIATLEATLVDVRLTIEPDGAQVEDVRIPASGDRVTNRYGPVEGTLELGLRAGRHELTIALDGYDTQRVSFEAEAGKTIDKRIALTKRAQQEPARAPAPRPTPEPEPAADSDVNVPAFVMVGVTAAVAIGAAVTGGLALVRANTFDDANDGTQVDEATALRSEAKNLNIATDVLLGVTAASAIVTVILFAVPLADEGEEAAWRLVPAAGTEGGGLMLGGAF